MKHVRNITAVLLIISLLFGVKYLGDYSKAHALESLTSKGDTSDLVVSLKDVERADQVSYMHITKDKSFSESVVLKKLEYSNYITHELYFVNLDNSQDYSQEELSDQCTTPFYSITY